MSAAEQTAHPNERFVRDALNWLPGATLFEALDFYEAFVKDPKCDDWTIAQIGKGDRFFLLTHLLRRPDAIHPWLYERCREVEREPDGYLDLWSREHYKSTIITFAGAIQEILNDPDITIGIFSHTRPIAKGFLSQIKREFESNDLLKQLYSDVLWSNPAAEAPTWSLDGGIIVKRKSNPKEATVEAWGIVDGQPTSRHFALPIYDDVVTKESVYTPEQIVNTTTSWELSLNLGSGNGRAWYIGTRYKYGDTYEVILKRKSAKARIYPATHDGTPDGKPVFFTAEQWAKKRRDMGPDTVACQLLQNPAAGSQQELKAQWIRRYEIRPRTLNVYILFDYAGSRKSTGSSRTAMAVIGIDSQLNKYVLDGACHKMDLKDRWQLMKYTRKRWLNEPGVQIVRVGYERFGAQSDIQHFEEMMLIEGEAFEIVELNWPRDGDFPKDNRIRRLVPDLANWRWFWPHTPESPTRLQQEAMDRGEAFLVPRPILRKNEDERAYNVIDWVLENEYPFFPNTTAKDWLDAASRIYDMEATAPQIIEERDLYPEVEE